MRMLYHRLPDNFIGDTLYPLNQLKYVLQDVYAEQVKKYQGREFILREPIPILNCLWNDVLHFSPVHPLEIHNGLLEAGIDVPERQYFEVDPSACDFNEQNAVIYLSEDDTEKDAKWVLPFSFAALEAISPLLPDSTKAYYKAQKAINRRPLLYRGVPHVLYKGSLRINVLNLITA
jgi:hypothetical protein